MIEVAFVLFGRFCAFLWLLFRDRSSSAEHVLLNFPCRRLGQLRNKRHAVRRLEVCEIVARKFTQLLYLRVRRAKSNGVNGSSMELLLECIYFDVLNTTWS